MAASTLSLSSHFISNFRPEVRGDTEALALVFSQSDIGRPFFYACEDPNMIGFIYTNKHGHATQKHLHIKSHFTGEVVSIGLFHRLGILPAAGTPGTLPHLIATYWARPTLPHSRPSSDPNAISLTFTHPGTGVRADLRLHFYIGDNDAPVLVTAADLDHIYSSSYDRYYWNPIAAATAATAAP